MSSLILRTVVYRSAIAMMCLLTALPSAAQLRQETRIGGASASQDEEATPAAPPPLRPAADSNQVGGLARSSVGQLGQRQDRTLLNPTAKPMARISNRIQNRVQLRIRNRIDRSYSPQANATSPFAVAEEETRPTPRRR